MGAAERPFRTRHARVKPGHDGYKMGTGNNSLCPTVHADAPDPDMPMRPTRACRGGASPPNGRAIAVGLAGSRAIRLPQQ
jgi:hypothetical protein